MNHAAEDATPAETQITGTVAELIALAAAMAANNEEAFQGHYAHLCKLGAAREDMIQAVNIALQVKMAPHRALVEMAEHYLVGEETGGCCGGGECSCEGEGGECGCEGEEGGCGCH